MSVSSVEGGSVYLPCNMTSPIDGDKVRLVLWFKNISDKPIYTFDTRGEGDFMSHARREPKINTLLSYLQEILIKMLDIGAMIRFWKDEHFSEVTIILADWSWIMSSLMMKESTSVE